MSRSPAALLVLLLAGAAAASAAPASMARRHPHHMAKAYALGAQAAEFSHAPYTYSTKWFNQTLDHFSFAAPQAFFQQRYLVNLDSYAGGDAPVFFYTGNEGPAPLFLQNTGFMFEAAQEFGAAVVVAEHRYYGATMPFGNDTFKHTANLQWLTSEQALADYSVLVDALKDPSSEHYLGAGAEGAAVVAFGGSYGGMLTAWARMKYPHVFAGGIAASAPIWQFTGLAGDETFSSIATRTFNKSGAQCADGIASTWKTMKAMPLDELSRQFHLCEPLSEAGDVDEYLFPWISGALAYMAMADYPYPSTFLGPMPASPVDYSCRNFFGGAGPATPLDAVDALFSTCNVFYNFSGQAGQCFSVKDNEPSTLSDAGGWNYQACTEMVMPVAQDGVHDMFYPMPWDLEADVAACAASYNGTQARPEWVRRHYGGYNIAEHTNIVFSNGNLDPWSGGGVTKTLAPTLPAVYIDGGAHHLDLRASNPADPPSVVAARNTHRANIRAWIAQWKSMPQAA